MSTKYRKKLEAVEVSCLPENEATNIVEKWISSKIVLDMVGVKRKLLVTIRERQVRFVVHVARKGGTVMLEGKIDGRRSRGRRRQSLVEGLVLAAGCGAVDILWRTSDRAGFKRMIANVSL